MITKLFDSLMIYSNLIDSLYPFSIGLSPYRIVLLMILDITRPLEEVQVQDLDFLDKMVFISI